MYAIVKTGGKQYKVTEGLIFETELLSAEVGAKLNLDVVLAADGDKVVTDGSAKVVRVKNLTSLRTKRKRTFVNVKVTDNPTLS